MSLVLAKMQYGIIRLMLDAFQRFLSEGTRFVIAYNLNCIAISYKKDLVSYHKNYHFTINLI